MADSEIDLEAKRLLLEDLHYARHRSSHTTSTHLESLPPSDLYAVADFCLIPMGTGEPSVAEHIAECQRVLEKSGLKFKMHGYGTNLEGPWPQVSQAIHDCHVAVHARGAPRIATDIRIGTRTDREATPGSEIEGKVKRVEAILAKGKN